MDSNINNEKNGMQQDPLSWENMKDVIFEKVLDENPEYFTAPKKKRRGLWILLPVVASLLFVAIYALSGVTDRPGSLTPVDTSGNTTELNETTSRAESHIQSGESTQEYTEVASTGHIAQDLPEVNQSGSPAASPFVQINEPTSFEELSNDRLDPHMTADTPISGETKAVVSNTTQHDLKNASSKRSRIYIQPLVLTDKARSLSSMAIDHDLIGKAEDDVPDVRPDLTEYKKSPECRWALHATAGGLFSSSLLNGSSQAVPLRNDHSSGLFGFTNTIAATYGITKSTNLYVGLSYAQAYQNIDIATEREIEVTESEALLHVRHFVVGSRRVETYGDTTVNAVEKNRLVYTNTFRWLHLSLGAGHTFELNKWHLRPTIGASLGRLWSEGYTVAADGQILKYDKSNPIHAQHSFKLWGALALSRQLNDRMAFNIAYRIDKQLNNASVESGVVFKPVIHQLEVGLALRFGCK